MPGGVNLLAFLPNLCSRFFLPPSTINDRSIDRSIEDVILLFDLFFTCCFDRQSNVQNTTIRIGCSRMLQPKTLIGGVIDVFPTGQGSRDFGC